MTTLTAQLMPYDSDEPRLEASALGINGFGTVAGTSYTRFFRGNDGLIRGLSSPRATCWFSLPLAPDKYRVAAIAQVPSASWQLNDKDDVLIAHFDGEPVELSERLKWKGFKVQSSSVWRSATGGLTNLTARIHPESIVTGMNNNDLFVGWYIKEGNTTAFKYDLARDVRQDLPVLGGSQGLRPVGIDDLGRIVACLIAPDGLTAQVFWLPTGGTNWISTGLNAARFQTKNREAGGRMYQSDESQFARVSSKGVILASHVSRASTSTVSYYLDMSRPVYLSQGPYTTPSATAISRVKAPVAGVVPSSRQWGTGYNGCLVGEESPNVSGSGPQATIHVGINGYLLNNFVLTRVKSINKDINTLNRALGINESGNLVVNCTIAGSIPSSTPGLKTEPAPLDRPCVVSIPISVLLGNRRRFSTLLEQSSRRRVVDSRFQDVLTALEIADSASVLSDVEGRTACIEVVLDILERAVRAQGTDLAQSEGIVAVGHGNHEADGSRRPLEPAPKIKRRRESRSRDLKKKAGHR